MQMILVDVNPEELEDSRLFCGITPEDAVLLRTLLSKPRLPCEADLKVAPEPIPAIVRAYWEGEDLRGIANAAKVGIGRAKLILTSLGCTHRI